MPTLTPTPVTPLAFTPTLLPVPLLLPAIQYSRESGRREPTNNLKQFTLATH